MLGEIVSHYRITKQLGAGGMGVVYQAEDVRHGKTVAVKFLPPELSRDPQAKRRFVEEARSAFDLDHPNICRVLELDETEDGRLFLAMACYEGETLRERLAQGPVSVAQAVDIAVQVASGLAVAHEQGVVHRDIKPANIFLTAKGEAKILDFGLAKLIDRTQLTRTGTTLGTPLYMSPEQARGSPVDERTDLWSLGATFYEMVAGQPPFKGEHEQAVIYSILNEAPEALTGSLGEVSMGLKRIVAKCLAKDLAGRYATAGDLGVDLQSVQRVLDGSRRKVAIARPVDRRSILRHTATAVVGALIIAMALLLGFDIGGVRNRIPGRTGSGQITSLAVLPLENLMNDPDQDYFVVGMHEALITELSKISALTVISRTSARRYANSDKSVPEIARELGVDAVVEGSVLRADGSVRITAQLIEGATDRHLWADNFDRQLRDVLVLHSDVARAIAGEIRIALTPQEETRLADAQPVNSEAYEYYLKGLYHYDKWTKDGFERAIEYFGLAIEADPNHARAYDGLADSYLWLGYRGDLPRDEALAKANPYLRKALDIDDLLAQAHETLAGIKHYYEWDWAGAETGYKRAIELDPSFVEAHLELALLLMGLDRSEEAIAEAKLAKNLDPLSLPAIQTLGNVYYTARQYGRAISQYSQMAELEPRNCQASYYIARVYERMGRYEEAVRARKKYMVLADYAPEKVAALDSAFSESGRDGYWLWHLQETNGRHERDPVSTAKYYAQLSDKDQAFEWLEKAYESHDPKLWVLKVEPYWDPLRDDLRYQDLLRRMNLGGQ